MPFVKIEVKKSWPEERKKAIISAIQEAMIETLLIKDNNLHIRYAEYLPEDFATPPISTPNYMIIEIQLFIGRTLEIKKNLYHAIMHTLKKLDIIAEDIAIILHEISRENLCIRGFPAAEAEQSSHR